MASPTPSSALARDAARASLLSRQRAHAASLRARRSVAARPPQLGLGDAVAALLSPLVRASDALLGTHLKTCPGCARRRAALNRAGRVVSGAIFGR